MKRLLPRSYLERESLAAAEEQADFEWEIHLVVAEVLEEIERSSRATRRKLGVLVVLLRSRWGGTDR